MTIFLWFLLGLWVGGTAGLLLFACLQASRYAERAADAMPATAIRNSERRMRDRSLQMDLFAPHRHKVHTNGA